MIHAITAPNRHLYEDVIEQHFRTRHNIFVEERRWETLRKPDGREIDSYDNEDTIYLLALEDHRVVGGYRIYPTTKPTIMSEIFPHLAAVRGYPEDPLIWEVSRYFIVPDRRDGLLNQNWHLARNAILHMTTNIANPADNLRAALKQAGFNARKVSVRQHHSTLYVTLRDAPASLSRVTEIAGQFEQVRRDHATGEILCGGYVASHITTVMW